MPRGHFAPPSYFKGILAEVCIHFAGAPVRVAHHAIPDALDRIRIAPRRFRAFRPLVDRSLPPPPGPDLIAGLIYFIVGGDCASIVAAGLAPRHPVLLVLLTLAFFAPFVWGAIKVVRVGQYHWRWLNQVAKERVLLAIPCERQVLALDLPEAALSTPIKVEVAMGVFRATDIKWEYAVYNASGELLDYSAAVFPLVDSAIAAEQHAESSPRLHVIFQGAWSSSFPGTKVMGSTAPVTVTILAKSPLGKARRVC